MEFRLPELGEGISDATVVNVAVKVGDRVTAGQTLFEVETDKAAMPVPATSAGTVVELRVKSGDKVKVNQVMMVLSGGPGEKKAAKAAPAPATPPASKPTSAPSAPAKQAAPATGKAIEFKLPALGEGIEGGTIVSLAVKPGDAVKKDQELFTIETDKASMPVPSPSEGRIEELRVKAGDKVTVGAIVATIVSSAGSAPAAPVEKSSPVEKAAHTETFAKPQEETRVDVESNKSSVAAGPATRRLARELGINLFEVTGSARGGRITIDDLKNHVRRKMTQPAPAASPGGIVIPPLPDFSKYGPIDKKPVSNIRKKIAENLTLSWHIAPAVTQFDLADITELEAGRKRIAEGLPKGSPKVTMTVLAIKAIVAALKEFPNFNSALDAANGVQVFKQYYHVGIAVDTERGLVVPVIRDADKKSIRDLAKDISELAEKARTNKLAIDEMRGGCFTITNLGGIGGTAFSPIINYPEVAILGMARSSLQPVVRDGKIEPRLMLPLCLTYDHRVIDGADGARFTTRLVQLFSDPIRLLMES